MLQGLVSPWTKTATTKFLNLWGSKPLRFEPHKPLAMRAPGRMRPPKYTSCAMNFYKSGEGGPTGTGPANDRRFRTDQSSSPICGARNSSVSSPTNPLPCDHHAACVQPSRPTPPRNLCTTTSLLKLYVAWPPTSLDTLSVMFLTSPTTNSWDQLKAVCPSL